MSRRLISGVRLASLGDAWPEAGWRVAAREAAEAIRKGSHLRVEVPPRVPDDVRAFRERTYRMHALAGGERGINRGPLFQLWKRVG